MEIATERREQAVPEICMWDLPVKEAPRCVGVVDVETVIEGNARLETKRAREDGQNLFPVAGAGEVQWGHLQGLESPTPVVGLCLTPTALLQVG